MKQLLGSRLPLWLTVTGFWWSRSLTMFCPAFSWWHLGNICSFNSLGLISVSIRMSCWICRDRGHRLPSCDIYGVSPLYQLCSLFYLSCGMLRQCMKLSLHLIKLVVSLETCAYRCFDAVVSLSSWRMVQFSLFYYAPLSSALTEAWSQDPTVN